MSACSMLDNFESYNNYANNWRCVSMPWHIGRSRKCSEILIRQLGINAMQNILKCVHTY